ncbi:glycoside hydrolase family 78 protein [Maribellus maritimus]|uniref:glycoside hydrolase family 78 protein n=1 Tax=Maribellus maritimus TaxID=2870838 RepID=UPI001EEC165D|nr:glycoside hydrolase family 78 protein [Maribellus maritimus]MCG6187875.1 glycoside hydrolase family 78 protein [Maribellus maritimus]
MKKVWLIFLLIFDLAAQNLLAFDVKVENLKTEMRVNPLAVEARNPRLSWEITGEQRGIVQTHYQIIVSSSPGKLKEDIGDVWNSGKVYSDKSVNVLFKGSNLKERETCYWKVKVWTPIGESKWSEPAFWSVGLRYQNSWTGRWIGFERAFPWDEEAVFSKLSARYFRREFEVKKEVLSAKAYIVGLGLYELFFNGEKIGTQELAPTPTDFLKNVKYNVFDVTGEIQPGKNAIGTILGNGKFYSCRKYKFYKIKDFGYPKMLFQLEIDYADGTKDFVVSDETWKGTADGPIRSNNEYDGEEYDARKEMPGWNNVGFDEKSWLAAEVVDGPPGDIEAQMNKNMSVMTTVKPVSITHLTPEKFVLDMGQNMVGWIRFKVRGKRGEQISLKFAEIVNDKNEIATDNLRDAKSTDVYTLKGEGTEEWNPTFVYHGFRYVEVTGYPGKPDLTNFIGEVVYNNVENSGTFESSNLLLNQIFKNAWWGINGNYKGVPVDCPQRNEREPWLGDRAIGCYGESFLFGNENLYAKWLDDIRLSQKKDGSICDVAPAYWKYYSDNMTWPGTFLMVADMLYTQFGYERGIVENYAAMKKWLEYMKERYMNNDFIVTKDSYGDWCEPPVTIEEGMGKTANVKYPSTLIATAYYYYFMQLMQKFTLISGQVEDMEVHEELAQKIKKGFNEHFFNSRSSFYGENKLTENLLPLYFGMVPGSHEQKVFNTIVEIIEKENDGHLSTGMIGVQWLMRTLTENGRADLAYQLATNTTYPSWGYMIENGATAIWELWNGNSAAPDMNSYNHVMMLGDLLIWYYENLAGIKSGSEAPGFKQIIMKPEIIDGLDFVNASYRSNYGLIKSSWEKTNNKFRWKVEIPANTSAIVYIPGNSVAAVTEGGLPLNNSDIFKFIKLDKNRVVYRIGSGTYDFVSGF